VNSDLEILIRLYDTLADAGVLEEKLSRAVYWEFRENIQAQIDDMTGPDPSFIDAVRWAVLDTVDKLKPGLGEDLPGSDIEIIINSLKEEANEQTV
jgi:hypothetical protein